MSSSISKSLGLAVALFLSIPALMESSRIKIHTYQPLSVKSNRILRTSTTACEDMIAVDRNSLNLVGQLSMLNERVRFFRSSQAMLSIDALLSSHLVVGLNMVSASIVLEVLKREGCPVYIFGGIVRDQFLGVASNDVDVEVDCSIATVVAVCRREWGEEVCGQDNLPITHIGTSKDPLALDLASTSMTFYGPLTNLEYTANSLAYDLNGLNVVLDITGNGVEDVCNRNIRIPSDDGSRSSWEAWSTPERLYRYWKLRFKGFTALDSATDNYITSEVKVLIDSDTPRGANFKKFYCKKVFDESPYSVTGNACQVTAEVCAMGRERALRYNMLLASDLGEEYIQTLSLPMCSDTASAATANRMRLFSLGLTFIALLVLTTH